MNTDTRQSRRRRLLGAPFAALAGWLLLPARRAHAQQKATLLAKLVARVPTAPEDPAWESVDALDIPLAPQAVVKPRTYEASITGVAVRALYDEDRLALRLEWRDAASEAMKGGVSAFRDALAVEFPSDPKGGIPFFGMGEANRPVTIYQWKSDWRSGANNDADEKYPHMAVDWYPFSGRGPGEIAEAVDYGKKDGDKAFLTSWAAGNTLGDPALQAQRSVEKLVARGFGTITPVADKQQDGEAIAAWRNGVWMAVLTIPRAQEKFTFARGQTVPVAFAAWDGAKSERGGEKAVSTWYFLSLEQPGSVFMYVAPLLVVAGAAAVELAGLHGLRARRAPGGKRQSFGAALRGWIVGLRARFARGKS
ncbi:MAG: hypothetical protein HYY78_06910 [Betaproteobacteria bacterium]|nr:hypothetical protein [Betaproteobacteria bacterium]